MRADLSLLNPVLFITIRHFRYQEANLVAFEFGNRSNTDDVLDEVVGCAQKRFECRLTTKMVMPAEVVAGTALFILTSQLIYRSFRPPHIIGGLHFMKAVRKELGLPNAVMVR